MRVTIRYFAAARERAGISSETLELDEAATAAEALAAACARHPALQPVAQRLRLAVDQEFTTPERKLRDGSEVALIPPVSGGAGPHRIGPAALAPEVPLREVAGADCGAVVSFVGTVRATNQGKRVVRLEYEAYPEMAEKVMSQIGDEMKTRWPISRVAIVHRTGVLEIGQASVVIAVSAPHRGEAFQAAQYAIDRLKQIVPIWKKEVWSDGSQWIGWENPAHSHEALTASQ